jgi:hypothetical protein
MAVLPLLLNLAPVQAERECSPVAATAKAQP